MDNSSLDILGHDAEQCNSTELNDFSSIFPHCVYLFLYKERREEGTEIEREGGERQKSSVLVHSQVPGLAQNTAQSTGRLCLCVAEAESPNPSPSPAGVCAGKKLDSRAQDGIGI